MHLRMHPWLATRSSVVDYARTDCAFAVEEYTECLPAPSAAPPLLHVVARGMAVVARLRPQRTAQPQMPLARARLWLFTSASSLSTSQVRPLTWVRRVIEPTP